MRMSLVLFLLVAALAGCATVRVQIISGDTPDRPLEDFVLDSLSHFCGVARYSSSMRRGDAYFATVSPGLPLAEEDLGFSLLSGTDLVGNVKAIDQAYRFAAIANELVEARDVAAWGQLSLNELYSCLLRQMPAASDLADLDLHRMTSATYNADFFLTIAAPSTGREGQWTRYERALNRSGNTVILEPQGATKSAPVPGYRLSALVRRLRLVRPWLKETPFWESVPRHLSACVPESSGRLALVTEVVLAEDLAVQKFAGADADTAIDCRQGCATQAGPPPTVSWQAKGPLLVGVIATLL